MKLKDCVSPIDLRIGDLHEGAGSITKQFEDVETRFPKVIQHAHNAALAMIGVTPIIANSKYLREKVLLFARYIASETIICLESANEKAPLGL